MKEICKAARSALTEIEDIIFLNEDLFISTFSALDGDLLNIGFNQEHIEFVVLDNKSGASIRQAIEWKPLWLWLTQTKNPAS